MNHKKVELSFFDGKDLKVEDITNDFYDSFVIINGEYQRSKKYIRKVDKFIDDNDIDDESILFIRDSYCFQEIIDYLEFNHETKFKVNNSSRGMEIPNFAIFMFIKHDSSKIYGPIMEQMINNKNKFILIKFVQ